MKSVSRLLVIVVVLGLCVAVVGTVAAAPVSQQSTTPLGQHTVKQGEWLYCIGRAYKVAPWDIATANAIPWPYWVYPGQVLTIPASAWYNIPAGQTCAPQFTPPASWPPPPPPTPTPGPVPPTPVPGQCRAYHTVLWGQTLSGISWYYGTTVDAMMMANPSIVNPNLIYAGQVLCVPPAPVPPAY